MSAWIRTRSVSATKANPKGKTYAVCYRRGGRGFATEHGGTFKTMAEARIRRDVVAGELAAGRDPKLFLDAMRAPRQVIKRKTVAEIYPEWLDMKLGLDDSSRRAYSSHRHRIIAYWGQRDPHSITKAEVQAWVKNELMEGADPMKPASIKAYIGSFQRMLDYAEVAPNPALVGKGGIELPQIKKKVLQLMSLDELHRIYEFLPDQYLLYFCFLDFLGLRVSELRTITWRDVSTRNELLLRESKSDVPVLTQPVPDTLMERLLESVPELERGPERSIFPCVKTHSAAQAAWKRAARQAGLSYTPHDLRHRRISLWHARGIPGAQIAAWVGHKDFQTWAKFYTAVVTNVNDDDYAVEVQ